jgi:hypothetical protein
MNKTMAYFIASGRTLAAINDFHARLDAHVDYMRAIANELGCERMWSSGAAVTGFDLPRDREPPTGLRRNPREHHMGVPNMRTPEGRAIRKRMNAAPPAPSTEEVMQRAGMRGGLFQEGGRYFMAGIGWETFDSIVVVQTPADSQGNPRGGAPADCERIPTSRYWLIKEAHEAASKAGS